MAKSSEIVRRAKPRKPYPDIPLFSQCVGSLAEGNPWKALLLWSPGGKCGSRILPVEDAEAAAQAAVDLYNLQRDDLHAGRTPRLDGDGLTLATLADAYLNRKRHLVVTRELSPRTGIDRRAFDLRRSPRLRNLSSARQPGSRRGVDRGAVPSPRWIWGVKSILTRYLAVKRS